MDELNPNELFSQFPASGHRRGSECFDDQILTAALDGEYRIVERPAFQAHVSSCDYCLARLARFTRLNRNLANAEIPEFTMAGAQRLFQSRRVVPRAPAWAAAAMIGFAALLSALWFARTPEPVPSAVSRAPEVRNIDPDGYRPQVLFPQEGASVVPGGPPFEWSTVPGTLHYDIRVVSADGTLIWQQRVASPEWRIPDQLHLAAGENYYFHVDAYVTQAKRLSSRHVMFRIKMDG